MDLQLQGKRALVTGSSAGIGEAIACALAREGAAVVVHGRREAEAQRVAAQIQAQGGSATVILGDLATDEGAAALAAPAVGDIDIVVNNAGVFVMDDWSAPDPSVWLGQYNLNVVSMIRVVRLFIEGMKRRGWGRFIQIGSGASTYPMPTSAAYAASKAGDANLTVSLARGLADTGVTANTVSPGIILTQATGTFMKDLARAQGWLGSPEEIERRFLGLFGLMPPTGRLGRVEEVADLVAFLASPRANYINGANLRIDGGFVPTVN